MFHVVLYQPEIPQNTGNVIRLCANSGVQLHLVRPLGFSLSERGLRRAGLDYLERASVHIHDDWAAWKDTAGGARVFALSTKGGCRYDTPGYRRGDCFVFGCESGGLPEQVLSSLPAERRLYLPMVSGSRSLNLANAVAIVAYEAWRQLGFAGAVAALGPWEG